MERGMKTDWLPRQKKTVTKHGRVQMHDGKPGFLRLQREEGENLLRADERVVCCDCGLDHLFSYEVYQQNDGKFFLVVRAYRISTDTAKQRARGKRRRK